MKKNSFVLWSWKYFSLFYLGIGDDGEDRYREVEGSGEDFVLWGYVVVWGRVGR